VGWPCFLLEHLSRPVKALAGLAALLRPGGTITVIEGDHGSALFHPDNLAAHEAIQSLIDLQRRAGGDALIGRQSFPMMVEAGFGAVHLDPRMVYVDASRPQMVEGFTRRTFTAMVEGVRERRARGGSDRGRDLRCRHPGSLPDSRRGRASSATPSSKGSARSDRP